MSDQIEQSGLSDYREGDDEYDEDGGAGGCNTCGGEGFIVICIDDMCQGAGECMHGDGEIPCPDCDGYL